MREEASLRLWNGYQGLISYSSAGSKEGRTNEITMLKELFRDVVFLTNWRPGSPMPTEADMYAVLDALAPCQWDGLGWQTAASTDQTYVLSVLRDYLYQMTPGPAGANVNFRFTTAAGAVDIPQITAGDPIEPFLDTVTAASLAAVPAGGSINMPFGVQMETQRYADAGAPIADINAFVNRAPICQDPVATGPWGPAVAGLGTAIADSTISFFVPINTHKKVTVTFSQTVAGNPRIRHYGFGRGASDERYRFVSAYPSNAINQSRDGVVEFLIEDGEHYVAGNGVVNVIYTIRNPAGDAENNNFSFNS
jgi:hypothetical protein